MIGPRLTRAAHIKNKTSRGNADVVAIQDLHVMLVHEDGVWFAQGIEIDYLSQGSSIEEAKLFFEKGLEETIDLNLKELGHIYGILRWAPEDVLAEYAKAKQESKLAFSTLIIRTVKRRGISRRSKQLELPFDRINIAYVQPKAA